MCGGPIGAAPPPPHPPRRPDPRRAALCRSWAVVLVLPGIDAGRPRRGCGRSRAVTAGRESESPSTSAPSGSAPICASGDRAAPSGRRGAAVTLGAGRRRGGERHPQRRRCAAPFRVIGWSAAAGIVDRLAVSSHRVAVVCHTGKYRRSDARPAASRHSGRGKPGRSTP